MSISTKVMQHHAASPPTPPLYPEHLKLAEIEPRSQTIGEFLEWLMDHKKLVIARYHGKELIEDYQESTEALLAEYFQIDRVKLEAEKRQMLEDIKKMSGGES